MSERDEASSLAERLRLLRERLDAAAAASAAAAVGEGAVVLAGTPLAATALPEAPAAPEPLAAPGAAPGGLTEPAPAPAGPPSRRRRLTRRLRLRRRRAALRRVRAARASARGATSARPSARPPALPAASTARVRARAASRAARVDERLRRARHRRARRRFRRLRAVAFLVTLVVLVAAIPVLAYIGYRVISESNRGRVVEPEMDAAAPGFQAVVEPTPTLLLVHEDVEGALAGLTVLGLGVDDDGGDVLFVPVGTMAEIPGAGLDRLGAAFDRGGVDLVRRSAEELLGIGFTETVPVDPRRWEELVGPVAPLRVVNPDPVAVQDGDGEVTVAFPAGAIDVAADEVSDLLTLQAPDETELARLVRHEAFWRAWLAAVADSRDADVVPGEVTTGLGRFVRGLAAGDVVYETLQVEPAPPSGPDGAEAYQADRDAVAAQISALLPFAAAPEGGDRPRVRVLNGTGEPGVAEAVTSVLVPAGAEIAVVGNAETFDHRRTQVVFYDQADEEAAERLRDALGVGEVVFSRVQNDSVDVTVVVGSDFEGSESTG